MTLAPDHPAVERLAVHNPVTDEQVGSLEIATADAVATAVDNARRAQSAWEELGFAGRSAVIGRFERLLVSHQEEILDTLQRETGKPRREALLGPLTVARTCQFYRARGRRLLRDRRAPAAVPGLTKARIAKKPHGVVGFITPWNYPFLLATGDPIPALLAGNAVVVKPSELTPLSAEKGAELLREAGVPEGVFSLVHGGGEIGAELVRRVDYISFTGSTAIGRKIAVAAGERLIPCSLELGGKNAMVVLDGAPIEQAVEGFLAGAFFNAGQTCIAVERVFVEDPIYDEVVELATEKAGRIRLGWSHDWDVEMGCLIDQQHADNVMAHIDDAVARGARVLTGGKRRQDLGPTFVEPTLLADVSPDATLYAEEPFGPVVALYRTHKAAETIERANDTPYGLHASIWGRNGAQSFQLARQFETGSVAINSTMMIYHSFGVPMGGVKQSGIGRRHGDVGLLRFTQSQGIVSSTTYNGGYDTLLGLVRSKRAASLLSKAFHWRSWIPGLR
jgi:succinate-semialdehyde dehydrogenase/glutarate-semialdehyde dehydrogenase